MAENRLHCFICGIVQRPRVLGRIPVDDPENRREIINNFRRNLVRPPADIDEQSRNCLPCRGSVNDEMRFENDESYTRLNVLRRVHNHLDNEGCILQAFLPGLPSITVITKDQFNEMLSFCDPVLENNRNRYVYKIDLLMFFYIEKSSNFQALRQSYCLHKGRHLVKPALIVAPDGYILDIHGPYFSDARNNDAAVLEREFQNDAGALREWLGENAIIIVDRGYRDVLPLLQNLVIETHMPPLLQEGQTQLSTEDANDSRLITKSRWIVEARNGHIKMIFKFFKGNITYHHVIHLREYYLIAGAVINRYREHILMEGATADLAREMLQRACTANNLQNKVLQENLGRDKLSRDNSEILQVDVYQQEAGLVRLRVYSRFRNATRYQLWVQFTERCRQHDNNEPILGYYCTCKTRARILGTCAHITSVLWFLGYARHQPNVKYPSTGLLDNIADAGGRNVRN
ncbi:hypothetical protein ALC57_02254 [Trachymyrmex cornetzi]|uniref:SWIM-type domain-containing protein n=1 Tax=Trachymyrmex cornetzi TaxID=471704 RepID=A0A151JPB3_9HYME|nr:hypothetical protein ALC57_02254 [Trachymyrmex cornetzi]